MSDTTNISWCDATWNPWRGCSKVSPGCKNCYAEKQVNRFGGDFSKLVKAAPSTFNAPLRWNKKSWVCNNCNYEFGGSPAWCPRCEDMELGQKLVHRRRVFLGSLMDWLDPRVPVEWLADALQVIRECESLDFLCLTKRPEQFKIRFQAVRVREQYTRLGLWCDEWMRGQSPHNVWVGTSAEDQKRADERIPELLKIPAKMRFLSAEPLLEPVKLGQWIKTKEVPLHTGASGNVIYGTTAPPLDWVIVGGESGPKRRACDVESIINIANQCRWAGVPVFVKQDCAAKPGHQGAIPDEVWSLKQFPI